MERIKKITAIFLLILVLTPLTFHAQDTISSLQQQEEKTQSELEQGQTSLNQANSDYDETVAQLQKISDKMTETKNEITTTQNDINDAQVKIKDLEDNKIPAMQDKAEASLKFSQKNMNSNVLLNMVLGNLSDSDNETSTLEERQASEQLSQATNDSLNNLVKALNELETEKQELKEKQTKLTSEEKDLSAQKKDYEKVENDLTAQIDKLEGDTNYSQDQLAAQKAQEKLYKEAGCGPNDVYGVDCAQSKMPHASSNSGFIRPLSHGTVTQNFGDMNYETGDTHGHSGIDLAAPQGTPVHATASGKVLAAGYAQDGGGNSIVLLHAVGGKNYISRYAHLSGIDVSPGQNVKQGQTIGEVGQTGTAYGAHLHFEMEQGNTYDWNSLQDPRMYVNFPPKGSSW